MTFASLKYIWFLWLIPILILLFILSEKSRTTMTKLLISAGMIPSMIPGLSLKRKIFKKCLLCLAILAMILALMRPQWGYELRELPQKKIEIFVLVDTSQSMAAQDLKPTRMDGAKRELIDFMSFLKGEKIGLIAFSGSAHLLCPMTDDTGTFTSFLNILDTQLISKQGTNIGAALQVALDNFSESQAVEKMILLVTDGEDRSEGTNKILDELKKQSIKLYIMGVGTPEGAPVPKADSQGFIKNSDGTIVMSKLNEAALKEMATQTGGLYITSTIGDSDWDTLYNKGMTFEKNVTMDSKGEKKHRIPKEQFALPLFFALLFLLLEGVLKDGNTPSLEGRGSGGG